MQLMVTPRGTAAPHEAYLAAKNQPMFSSLVGIAGALVQASVADANREIPVDVQEMRSDDVGIIWVVGPWVLHASDLRAGTMSQFCAMVRQSRARSAMAAEMGMPESRANHVMSLFAADEKIPVGVIVQIAQPKAPLPMIDFRVRSDIQDMWLVATHFNIIARVGEPAFRAALAAVQQVIAEPIEPAARRTKMFDVLKSHSIVGDEAVAAAFYPSWAEAGGAGDCERFGAMVAP